MAGFHYQLVYTSALAVLYAGSFGLVFYVVNPIQAIFLPDVTKFASLVFIPHGLRVMATVVMGAWAIPGLFLGAIYSTLFIWGIKNLELAIPISLISCSVAWLTLEGLKAFRINAYYLSSRDQMPALRTVLLAGLLCSFANSFMLGMVLEMTGSIHHVTYTMAAIAIGDMAGLIACWWLAKALLRLGTLNAGA
jgi:hypothetical protein